MLARSAPGAGDPSAFRRPPRTAVPARSKVAVCHDREGLAELRPAGGRRAKLMSGGVLPGGACDVGGDDIGGVPVQAAAGMMIPHRGARISMRRGFLDVAQRDPSVERGGNEGMPERVGRDDLSDPGATRDPADVRPAPCRSSRRPSAARNTGPPARSPMARSIARAVRGASGIVTTFPPLRVMISVRCPRSRPRCSMSAPVASETRSPFRASSEISACSGGEPSPAATSRAPSSLRSSAAAWDS